MGSSSSQCSILTSESCATKSANHLDGHLSPICLAPCRAYGNGTVRPIRGGDYPARERVRAIVPKMIELSEQVIYGDIWERPGLSKRDRSLIVVATLIATYRPEQLKGHLGRALDNGVTKDEIAEIITHLAFYAGWPASVTARRIAAEVYEERGLA